MLSSAQELSRPQPSVSATARARGTRPDGVALANPGQLRIAMAKPPGEYSANIFQ